MLYLLHGTGGTASDWVLKGDAEALTAGYRMIVVMPDVSLDDTGGSWCANWVDQSAGAANWETFEIDELVPWIDGNLPTIATRGGRAIAGLSMGGFCSMSFAAQYPDLFGTALAYSGAPDIACDPGAQLGAMAIINATEVGEDRVAPDSIFGDPATDGVNWAAHDPTTLAENLVDTDLLMYNGNGLPGPLDPSPVSDPSSVPGTLEDGGIEALVAADTQFFHNRLVELGIHSYWDPYGDGTHSWPYWTRDLEWSLPTVMADFDHPLPPPSEVTYTTADASYSEYGWQVTLHRTAEEFSTLEDADLEGFSLAGSGWAQVVTPSNYLPARSYLVVMSGDAASSRDSTVVADAQGCLVLTVPLGPPNPYQEYTPQALAVGTHVYTTTVKIQPAG